MNRALTERVLLIFFCNSDRRRHLLSVQLVVRGFAGDPFELLVRVVLVVAVVAARPRRVRRSAQRNGQLLPERVEQQQQLQSRLG